jgi:hypothetical protein
MSNKISITRALTELKTLDKRIQKAIDSGSFVSHQGQFYKPDEQTKSAQSNYQSIMDLLERRKKIKSSIVMCNAVTKVTICGKEMTVAEAIETKSSIKHLENLLNRLKAQYAQTNKTVEQLNDKVRRDLEGKTKMTNEKDDGKIDLVEFSRSYMDMHGVKLYDPIKISSKIEDIESYVTGFKSEVDFVLTEKNSTTFIEV